MEFSYKISEADYIAAAKMRRGALRSVNQFSIFTVRTVVFWVFVLICLMVLWGIVQHSTAPTPTTSHLPVQSSGEPNSTSSPQHVPPAIAIFLNLIPFAVVFLVWFFALRRSGSAGLRTQYRKDPLMQGTFTASITSDSISTRNTAGATSQTAWNVFERWVEGKDVMVLVMRSEAYIILNVAGLSDIQRNELRSILTAALPKK